ncbi:BgTH12-02053 [Blumeria graminis f. sp. triticale]|uniref:Vacuolar-sorting protein SNF8 n=3 Tax=Blumeria graminis TaxID=34373 RepID=A0A381L932_BLUGR|nr:Component of the ESCRT-II complex [Blumeria graminis f. sp. tritici 96224]CAD6501807.1 BgTH12-02053 [Blumeria graminis f. sp. triticale]VDB84455.1 Bgt-1451 [Blumeria graminis f. sp. tritici]
MSRKGVGLGAFNRSRITSAQYASHGNNLRTSHSTSLENQLSVFRSLLQQFAQSHGKEIRSNPSFRAEFARMCTVLGIDPLTSSHASGGKEGGGSFWAQLLGGSVNDFYFELAVRVVEVCSATREENGGLIGAKEVRDRIMSTKIDHSADMTEDDILRAVETLKPLGSSYSTVQVGNKTYIRSVPRELNMDQSAVLEAAQLLGYVSVSMIMVNLRWPRARAITTINDLTTNGMLWVDKQSSEWEYWSPGSMVQSDEAGAM